MPNTNDDNMILLTDENGIECAFEFLDLIQYHDNEYVILLPYDDTYGESKVVILQLEDIDSEDEESYLSVDDDDTLNAVFEIFKSKFGDEFDFAN